AGQDGASGLYQLGRSSAHPVLGKHTLNVTHWGDLAVPTLPAGSVGPDETRVKDILLRVVLQRSAGAGP
ncbi:MAG: hypothetical protein WKG03_15780, partial [Telluria sp.]